MTDDANKSSTARIAQIEDDVGSLKGEVGSLKAEFKILGGTVKGLSDDIAASDRKQETLHNEAIRRQEQFQKEWRDQKDAERREKDQLRRSRQLGPLQVLQIAATGVAIMAASFGGFFFLVKAYVDGSLTPQITQLTERQNASTAGAVARNEMIDDMRATQGQQAATLAETARIAVDNRDSLQKLRDRLREVQIEQARQDERLKAKLP